MLETPTLAHGVSGNWRAGVLPDVFARARAPTLAVCFTTSACFLVARSSTTSATRDALCVALCRRAAPAHHSMAPRNTTADMACNYGAAYAIQSMHRRASQPVASCHTPAQLVAVVMCCYVAHSIASHRILTPLSSVLGGSARRTHSTSAQHAAGGPSLVCGAK